jgi:nuclear transport factor 2 (NTF2) superfamily protein
MENPRPPLPPFDAEGAAKKARAAEDAWNSRDPQRVSLAYTPDSAWRNRAEFFSGREAIVAFHDLPITEAARKFRWPAGPRPADHPGLSGLGL